MTITIELTAAEEARLQQEAKRRRVEPAEYVQSLVHTALQERVSGYGTLRGVLPSVDEYLEEKRKETEREDARIWR